MYVDSCLIIYGVESPHTIGAPMLDALANCGTDTQFFISGLVRMECLVKPLRESDADGVRLFNEMFTEFTALELTRDVFDEAAKLRAHQQLKTPDALHLAVAQHFKCDELWTNDQRLSNARASIHIRRVV